MMVAGRNVLFIMGDIATWRGRSFWSQWNPFGLGYKLRLKAP